MRRSSHVAVIFAVVLFPAQEQVVPHQQTAAFEEPQEAI